ncbi:hypothetical protein ABZ912_06430 [Nonomuraea angiospora]|uniref:hypothetical protein n=1 Tax=Nonomuraea angiospora TaxID=46172 RepID=UPI00340447A6
MAPIGTATPAVTADDLVVLDGDHRRAAGLPTSGPSRRPYGLSWTGTAHAAALELSRRH